MTNLGYNLVGEIMVVKDVKFINNKVEIILDEKTFLISKENYINNPITIDSDISEEKISYLLEYEHVLQSKLYIIKLLNKKSLSEYEVYLKLKEKEIDSKYIIQIIDSLKRIGLINDEFAAIICLESMLIKRKGKNAIRKLLSEKKICSDIIEKVIMEINEEEYIENFNKVVDKYVKVYNNKSYKIKQHLIRQKLEELGYEKDLILKINIDEDSKDELELAKKQLIKIIKNKSIDLNSYENINKIKLKLAAKGFSYDIINKVIEEVVWNETY